MAKKKKTNAERVAAKLAAIALGRLSNFSEEEQQKRMAVAERRVASDVRAGSRRTPSGTPRTRKNRVSVRGR